MFGVVDLYAGFYGAEVRVAVQANQSVERKALIVRTPKQPAWTAEALSNSLRTTGTTFLPIGASTTDTDQSATGVLRGTCAQFQSLGARRCNGAMKHLNELDSTTLDVAAGYLPAAIEVSDTPSNVKATRFLVASTTGAPLNEHQLSASGFPSQVRFQQVGDEWAAAADFNGHQLRWLTLCVVPGTALLMASLLMGAWMGVRQRLASLRPLIVVDPKARLLWAASIGALLIPLLTSVIVGVTSYSILGTVLGTLYDGLHVSTSYVAAITVTGIAATIVIWLALMATIVTPKALLTANFED